MASWLTHLRIADKIKQKIKGIDLPYLMMGSIAPDANALNPAGTEALPAKEAFYEKYLVPERLFLRSDMTRSFLWGYYFRLLSDQIWQEQFIKTLSAEFAEQNQNSETSFEQLLKDETDAMDFDFLKEDGNQLLDELKNAQINTSLFYGFDPEQLSELKNRIIKHYDKSNQGTERTYTYLSKALMDRFIDMASDSCINMLL